MVVTVPILLASLLSALAPERTASAVTNAPPIPVAAKASAPVKAAVPVAARTAPAPVAEKTAEPVVVKASKPTVTKKPVAPAADPDEMRPAKITSKTTFYDRREGVAVFDRDVWVDDVRYQLHADKAYVFLNGTNEVNRIVALGHVALTNEDRRAYGAKISYYRDNGLVILYSGDGITAEVRDESELEPRIVKGSKIKFWIDSEQVEVLEADITAPTSGVGDARDLFRR